MDISSERALTNNEEIVPLDSNEALVAASSGAMPETFHDESSESINKIQQQ